MNLEKLADQIIQLSPDQAKELQVILKAKVMPEVEKQKGLLDEQQMANPQVDQMARPPEQTMAPPTARDVALRSLLG
jgi:hypothetical protein